MLAQRLKAIAPNRLSLQFLAALIAASLLLSLFATRTEAQSDIFGWKINSFHTDYVLSGEKGSMLIRESIEVDFSTSKHGIFREIPTTYRPSTFKPVINLGVRIISVTDNKGQPYEYQQSDQNGNVVLKIGDPDVVIAGTHTYVIAYSVDNSIRFFDDHDEFFWDINGTNWDVAMDSVSATVSIDKAQWEHITDVTCITGIFGLSGDDCSVDTGSSEVETYRVSSTRPLSPYENISVVIGFEKGTFIQLSWWELYSSVIVRHAGIVLVPLPILVLMYLKWLRKGKDIRGPGSIITQFDPPEGLSPAEIGTLDDYSVDNKDVTATVIDLAIRGVLKIIDTTKRDSNKKRQYTIELLTSDISELKPHEKELVNGMFSTIKKHQKVELKMLKNSFYTTLGKIKNILYREMTEHRYFTNNPHRVKTTYLVTGAFIGGAGLFSAAPTEARYLGWSLGLALAGTIISFFGLIMPKRTNKGVRATAHTKGLKQYLEVAEKDRLAMMQSPDSQYLGDVTMPEFTVELYEKLLPYALVLGVEKEWSEKFEGIYAEPPEWYTGNFNHFNASIFASRLSSGMNSMNTTMASRPSSSGSSGFSGGGSGGGFGGGGGGSW